MTNKQEHYGNDRQKSSLAGGRAADRAISRRLAHAGHSQGNDAGRLDDDTYLVWHNGAERDHR